MLRGALGELKEESTGNPTLSSHQVGCLQHVKCRRQTAIHERYRITRSSDEVVENNQKPIVLIGNSERIESILS